MSENNVSKTTEMTDSAETTAHESADSTAAQKAQDSTGATLAPSELYARFKFKRDGARRYLSEDGKYELRRLSLRSQGEPDNWQLTELECLNEESGEIGPKVLVDHLTSIMDARRWLAERLGLAVKAPTTKPIPEAEQVIETGFTGDARKAVTKLMDSLNEQFKERKDVIESLLAAVLIGENALMLGPPGTGKSALARAIANGFSATYFERLLTKQSKPDELFGPHSLAALKEGRYEREIDGWLPTVNFGFVDETLNGSPAILNNLLTLMNEHLFHNGNTPVRCPLITLFGATNATAPESKELDALWDRFVIRLEVQYVQREGALRDLLSAPEPSSGIQLSLDVLRTAQAEVAAIEVTDDTIEAVVSARNALHADKIRVSDRRLKKVVSLLRAFAWLDGEKETNPAHLMKCTDAMWIELKTRPKVLQVLSQFSDSTTEVIKQVLAAADEQVVQAQGFVDGAYSAASKISRLASHTENLRRMYVRLEGERAKVKRPRGRKAVDEAMTTITEMGNQLKKMAASIT